MRWAFVALMVLHGLIHFMGPAKAFGLADLPQLTQPISRGLGLLWALAGLAMLAAACHYVVAPKHWWITGLVAVALSQVVIVSSWTDARFGTLANLVVLAMIVYGFAARGPYSLRARYERDVATALEADSRSNGGSSGSIEGTAGAFDPSRAPLTEDDLAGLPEPVRAYVERSGALGRPPPWHYQAQWKGRIRGGPDEPWMEFTAEQHNFTQDPARFFYMDARRGGLPVAVYHDLQGGRARMRVRLLSMIPLVHETGPEMDRAESVTLFNDLAFLAPGALVDPAIEWETIDRRTARGRFTHGANTVQAVLHFGDDDDLVDFVSDDRFAADPEGGGFVRMRWSTPVDGWQTLDGARVIQRGEGRWHPEDGPAWAYVELELTELAWDP